MLLHEHAHVYSQIIFPLVAGIGVGMGFHAPYQVFTRALKPQEIASGTSAFFLVRFTGATVGLVSIKGNMLPFFANPRRLWLVLSILQEWQHSSHRTFYYYLRTLPLIITSNQCHSEIRSHMLFHYQFRYVSPTKSNPIMVLKWV